MELIREAVAALSAWMRPYLSQIAMAFVATLLVIYGNSLNRVVRRQIHHLNFIIRVLVFMVICAFGYGLAMGLAVPYLTRLLAGLDRQTLSPVVMIAFAVIGMLADHQNKI